MGPGTFEAKFIPLSKINYLDNIYVLRKEEGISIEKVKYIILPRVCKIKWIYIFVAPLLLLHYAKKYNAKIIISYHVIPHGFFAYFASRLSGIPYNISQTGMIVQRLSERGFIGSIIQHIFNRAHLINVPGTFSRKHWINKGIIPGKINILHSTISTDRFKKLAIDKQFDFIFVGRLAPEKNIELIFRALILLNAMGLTYRMVVVGEGPEREHLECFVRRNDLENQITFVGFQNDITSWLNKAGIFVMSSTTDAMPTALMQAMACELICISSNVGNIPDILIHGINGFLFESGNLGELSELLSLTLKSKDGFKQLRKNARDMVIKNHSHNSAVKKWDSHLYKLEQNFD